MGCLGKEVGETQACFGHSGGILDRNRGRGLVDRILGWGLLNRRGASLLNRSSGRGLQDCAAAPASARAGTYGRPASRASRIIRHGVVLSSYWISFASGIEYCED